MLMQVRSGFMAGGRSVPIPATYFGSGSSVESSTVSLPGSIASGDLGVLFDQVINGSSTMPTSVYPSGWTAIGTSQTASLSTVRVRFNMAYKVLDGTETTLTGMSDTYSNKLVLVFRKLASLTWGSPASVGAEANLSGPADKTVTVGTAPLIVLGAVMNTSALGMTPTQTATISGASGAYTQAQAGYIIYGAGAANNTITSSAGSGVYTAIGGFYFPLT